MRTAFLTTLAFVAACDTAPPTDAEPTVDIDALYEVRDEWADQSIETLMTETVELEISGVQCDVPRWFYVPIYALNPETGDGEGIHVEDKTFPISDLDEARPRIVNWQLEEDGTYSQVGLEWYFEPPTQEPMNPHPTIFGVELDGIMDPHAPFQLLHYDQHAWLWNYTSEENEGGYFGNFNKGMAAPSWWPDFEPALFATLGFNGPPNVYMEQGYNEMSPTCEPGVGWRAANVTVPTDGEPNPAVPNNLLVDQNMTWIGTEWVVADVGQERPNFFGQDFEGPNEDGNYTFRIWAANLMNPDGMFEPTNSLVDCDAPPAPFECLVALGPRL